MDGGGAEETNSLLYFREAPPGRIPEIFAAGIISDAGCGLHGSPVFDPDLTEIYWSVVPPAVMHVSLSDGEWGEAAPVPLQGRVRAPSVSPDGRFPFFLSGGDIYWVDMAVVLGLR